MQTRIWIYSKIFLFHLLLFGNYQSTSPESEITPRDENISFNITKVNILNQVKGHSAVVVTTKNPSVITGIELQGSSTFGSAFTVVPNSASNQIHISKSQSNEKIATAFAIPSEETSNFPEPSDLGEESDHSSSTIPPMKEAQADSNPIQNTEFPIINDKGIEADKVIQAPENPIPTPVDIKEASSSILGMEDSVIEPILNMTDESNSIESIASSVTITQSGNHSIHIIDGLATKGKDSEVPGDSEDMPSFDEWKKKMLAEQQVQGEKPVQLPSIPGKKQGTQNSKRRRNYASSECGAKIVAANPEAEAPNRILNEQTDMYMLNPCKAKIWFIIELCETIQATQFEMANFELFSSLPKHLTLQWSDNFPTREWTSFGSFIASEQRIVHTFNLKQHGYGKFLKVELDSYYGREHYCPLSLVRVYGTSMVDEYEEMETGGIHLHHAISDADEEKLDSLDGDGLTPNIFGSAREVVLDIVRKAARALGREDPMDKNQADLTADNNMLDTRKTRAKRKKKFHVSPNKTTHSLVTDSKFHSLGPLLDECGLCSETQDSRPCFHSLKCKFLLSIFNISAVASLCQTTACSLAELKTNTTDPSTSKVLLSTKSDVVEPTKLVQEVQAEQNQGETQMLSDSEIKMSQSVPPIDTTLESAKPEISNSSETAEQHNPNIVLFKNKTVVAPELVGTKMVHFPNDVPSLKSSLSETAPLVVIPDITKEAPQISPTPAITDADVSATLPAEDEQQQHQEVPSMLETFTLEDEEAAFINLPPTVSLNSMPVVDGSVDVRPLPVYNMGANIPTGQKESVFMRLSNRIKVLEMNMSLSSQYLQELSQRYRRQMEEMQRSFNRTVAQQAMQDTKQQDSIRQMQLVVANLTHTVNELTNERQSLYRQVLETHLFLLGTETIIVICILTLCLRRMNSFQRGGYNPIVNLPLDEYSATVTATTLVADNRFSPLKRHNSTTDVTASLSPEKKRRPSEMVSTAGTYADLMIVEPAMPIYLQPPHKPRRKNRNRKNHRGLIRSLSNPDLNVDVKCQVCCDKQKSGLMSSADDLSDSKLFNGTKSCENCCFYMPSLPTILSPGNVPKVPLKNLTNGKVPPEDGDKKRGQPASGKTQPQKETFSIRKLLKFQKRESV